MRRVLSHPELVLAGFARDDQGPAGPGYRPLRRLLMEHKLLVPVRTTAAGTLALLPDGCLRAGAPASRSLVRMPWCEPWGRRSSGPTCPGRPCSTWSRRSASSTSGSIRGLTADPGQATRRSRPVPCRASPRLLPRHDPQSPQPRRRGRDRGRRRRGSSFTKARSSAWHQIAGSSSAEAGPVRVLTGRGPGKPASPGETPVAEAVTAAGPGR